MSHSYDHGGNIHAAARKLGVGLEEIADFSASINPLGLSPFVRKSIICALDGLVHYPDNSHRELKQALARHHGVAPANIVIANGSTELIYHLPAVLPGSRALIVSPSFSEYARSLAQHHWEIQHFTLTPESNFAIDCDRLGEALQQGIDTLYLCNPGNPNGTLYPQRVIERIYSLCIAAGTFLVLDEAFMDFCEDVSAKGMVVHGDNGIVLRSMTKYFGIPGLRLGYAICNSTLAERLDAMGGPWSVNSLALTAGSAALADSEFSLRTQEFIRTERRYLFEQLEKFHQLRIYPSSANYLLCEIREGMSAPELKERLFHQRILVRDCSNFLGLSSAFFRVAVRSRQENERLLVALRRLFK